MRINLDSGDGPKGILGKGCMSAFFFVFFAMGLGFTVFIVYAAYQAVETRGWDKTDCHVLSSVVTEKRGEDPYRFEVEYAYTHGGRGAERRSSTYTRGYAGSSDYSDASRLVGRYSAGSKAKCFVNPKNPSEAVLDHGSLMMLPFIVIPLIFVAVGAGGIYFTLRGKKKRGLGRT